MPDVKKKLCFVIMPYGARGGVDEEMYTGVYKNLIERAAELEGYKAKRSDFEPTDGNILRDIITDLSRADLVIADVSSGGPSTMWELGVRHALRRQGTILIKLDSSPAVFNLQGYQTVFYSHTMASLPKDIDRLREMIRLRDDKTRCDSPVFDTLPESDRLLAINDRMYAGLTDENLVLKSRLAELQKQVGGDDGAILAGNQPTASLHSRFELSGKIHRLRPEQLYERLRKPELQESDKFVEAVEEVLSSPELRDPDSFAAINQICRERREFETGLVVAEEWYKRTPESIRALSTFASSLLISGRRADETPSAIAKIEASLGIRGGDGKPLTIKHISTAEEVGLLRTLTDLYEYEGDIQRSKRTLQLFALLPESISQGRGIMLNKARALVRSGKPQESFALYKQLCDEDSKREDAQARVWYAEALGSAGRNEEAYEYLEEAVVCDPTDYRLYIGLAEHILLAGFLRRSSEGKVERAGLETRTTQAGALFEYVLGRWRSRNDVIQRVVLRLEQNGFKGLQRRLAEGRERSEGALIQECPPLARILAQAEHSANSSTTDGPVKLKQGRPAVPVNPVSPPRSNAR